MSDKPIMMTPPKEVEFEKKTEQSVNEIITQINKKKWAIIKQKLKEEKKLNLLKDLDIKRFKPIIIEIDKDKEVVYYNNGTVKGKRLVTFLRHTESEILDKEFRTKLVYY